jgi:hypothetical protein
MCATIPKITFCFSTIRRSGDVLIEGTYDDGVPLVSVEA